MSDLLDAQSDGVLSGLIARVEVALGLVRDSTDRTRQWLTAQQEPRSIRRVGSDISGLQGVAPSGGQIIFDLGHPGSGFYWMVRQIAVGGKARSTTAAGTADVYSSPTPPTVLALTDLEDFANTLPDIAFYGRGDLAVYENEHLWVVVIGGTSGQQYVARARVNVFQEGSGPNQ